MDFISGCQALTFTTNVLGVGPRKAPSGQSILSEIFGMTFNLLFYYWFNAMHNIILVHTYKFWYRNFTSGIEFSRIMQS